MEFIVVLLIVLATGAWLGVRAYRFFRHASKPPQPGAPACSGCTACTPEEPDTSCPVVSNIEEPLNDQPKESVR